MRRSIGQCLVDNVVLLLWGYIAIGIRKIKDAKLWNTKKYGHASCFAIRENCIAKNAVVRNPI